MDHNAALKIIKKSLKYQIKRKESKNLLKEFGFVTSENFILTFVYIIFKPDGK